MCVAFHYNGVRPLSPLTASKLAPLFINNLNISSLNSIATKQTCQFKLIYVENNSSQIDSNAIPFEAGLIEWCNGSKFSSFNRMPPSISDCTSLRLPKIDRAFLLNFTFEVQSYIKRTYRCQWHHKVSFDFVLNLSKMKHMQMEIKVRVKFNSKYLLSFESTSFELGILKNKLTLHHDQILKCQFKMEIV